MKFFTLIFLFFALLWIGIFMYFLSMIPTQQDIDLQNFKKADAVVIFTGDNRRIEEGLELSNNNDIKYILISGVANKSTLEQIVDKYVNKKAYLEKIHSIELGKKATNTVGNIMETKEWAEKNNFHSIIIVTSNYHVPRCKALFRKKLISADIIIYPTFSDKFDKKSWWKNLRSVKLIINEYHKYLACKIALFISDL